MNQKHVIDFVNKLTCTGRPETLLQDVISFLANTPIATNKIVTFVIATATRSLFALINIYYGKKVMGEVLSIPFIRIGQ